MFVICTGSQTKIYANVPKIGYDVHVNIVCDDKSKINK